MDYNFTPEEIITSKNAFSNARHVYDEMLALYDKIMANKSVCSVINKEIRMPQPNGKDVDIPYKVMLVMYIDLIKCYQNMGHPIQFNNKDSYLLPMITNLKFREEMSTEIEFEAFMAIDEVAFLYKNLLRSFEGWAKNDGSEFLFTRFAKETNTIICKEYVNLMLLASDYIKRATPTNIRKEYKWTSDLKQISF